MSVEHVLYMCQLNMYCTCVSSTCTVHVSVEHVLYMCQFNMYCTCVSSTCTVHVSVQHVLYMCQFNMYSGISGAHQSHILQLFVVELLESPEGILVYGEGHSMKMRLSCGSADVYVILHTEQNLK